MGQRGAVRNPQQAAGQGSLRMELGMEMILSIPVFPSVHPAPRGAVSAALDPCPMS